MVKDLSLVDETRQREIPVRAHLPKADGPCPLIVFSHGLGGTRTGYRFLAEHWAANGFVVLLPTHFGSDDKIFAGQRPSRFSEPAKKAGRDPDNWRHRPLDVSFLLSAIREIENQVPELVGKIDESRTGIGGHSFGTYTAAALAGMGVEMPGEGRVSFLDERPRAFFGMSPQGPGSMPFLEEGWASIERPFYFLTGTHDRGYDDQPPEWRWEAYRHTQRGDKYLAVLNEADHLTFAGIGTRAGPTFLDPIREVTLAFWNAYLRGDPNAKQALRAGRAEFARFEYK